MGYSTFYEDGLYPLQNKVLSIAECAFNGQFYLTGGTALSRCYFHHRYSDDLDFFSMSALPDLEPFARRLWDLLKEAGYEISCDRLSPSFCSFFCGHKGVSLKVDMVNDVVVHHGDIQRTDLFTSVDNVGNILSNKITAITRCEAKDVADIWVIARNRPFVWRDLLADEGKKEGVDPLMVAHLLRTAPVEILEKVKWITPVKMPLLQADLTRIAEDVLLGRANSLYFTK